MPVSQCYAGRPGRTSGQGSGASVSGSNVAVHPSGRNVHREATSPLTVTMSMSAAITPTVDPH